MCVMKFCLFILKILRGNEILRSFKGYNITLLQTCEKIKPKNPKLDLVIMHIENLVKFSQFIVKILSGNEILA